MEKQNQLAQYVIEVKRKYPGSAVFITIISDNLVIPWKSLSIGDYIFYSKASQEGRFPLSVYEDEIFRKCVLDQSIVRQISFLKAGIISTVVENIWATSCANTVEQLNSSLEEARYEAKRIAPAIHELVSTILFAFPAYKPEDVYSLDYNTLMKRAVDAEIKLMQSQIIKEEIRFYGVEEEGDQPSEQPKVDPRQLWEEQQKSRPKRRRGIDNLFRDLHQKKKESSLEQNRTIEKKSPIIEALDQGLPLVLDQKEAKNSVFHGSGHDIIDKDIMTHKMIEEAKVLYSDVIEELRKRREKGVYKK